MRAKHIRLRFRFAQIYEDADIQDHRHHFYSY